jgi:hypothetical protein
MEKSSMQEIQVGTRVYCALMGGRCGIVYQVHGEPGKDPIRSLAGGVVVMGGSSAHYDVVFDNGTLSKKVPECIIKGVQWRILDEDPATAEQIAEALRFAEETAAKAEDEKRKAAAAFDAEVKRLRSAEEWSYLEQFNAEKPVSPKKLAAKNIRKFLKKEFPGVKFSVRMDGHSCIWVTWPRECSSDEINQTSLREKLEMFKTGYYDQLSDCHLSKSSPFNVVFGGTEYFTIQPQY